jgi:hypothetical protein
MAFNKSMAERMEEQIKSKEMHQKERLALKAMQLHMKEVEHGRAFKLQEQQLKHQADALRFFSRSFCETTLVSSKTTSKAVAAKNRYSFILTINVFCLLFALVNQS